jgi:hypothetical protein
MKLLNHCTFCFINMGESNPRQYCYKRYCPYEDYEEDYEYLTEIRIRHLKESDFYEERELETIVKELQKC